VPLAVTFFYLNENKGENKGMGISAQDYQQWHDTQWLGAWGGVREVVQAFQNTVTALSNGDANRFVVLTGGEAPDGLHKTTDAACELVATAKNKLKELQIPEDQRKLTSPNAIAAFDAAIKELDQLFFALSLAQTDLVRGVRPEYEDVRDDAENIKTVASGDLPNRLRNTVSRVELCFADTEPAVDALISVPDDELTVSKPTVIEMTADRVERSVVEKFNEQALKTLSEGTTTAFYEIGDLIIIDAKLPPKAQPYLEWAEQQKEINPGATITMIKKGGAFDQGKIKAVGVRNTVWFEAAIKRVSKKKIEY
jgi:hypothetical protein